MNFRRGVVSIVVFALTYPLMGCGAGVDKTAKESQPPTTALPSTPSEPTNPFETRIPNFGPTPTPIRVALPNTGELAPVVKRVPTDQPVAFITIDDGTVRPSDAHNLLRARNTPASAFLISPVAAQDPHFFRSLTEVGVPIQAHSVSHTSLRGKAYDAQKQEICGSADALDTMFGKRPTLFRPPYGEYDNTTLKAAKDCGITAVLYWTQSVTDGHVYYQTPEKRVQKGDIILMHFRENFVNDYLAALQAIYDSGLTPALLEDYIG